MPVASASYRQSSASRPSAAAASPSMSDLRWLTGAHVYNRLKRLQRRPIRSPHRDEFTPGGSSYPPCFRGCPPRPGGFPSSGLGGPAYGGSDDRAGFRARGARGHGARRPDEHRGGDRGHDTTSGGVRAQRRATARESKRPRYPRDREAPPSAGAPFDPKHAPRTSGMASASNENLVTGIPGTRLRTV